MKNCNNCKYSSITGGMVGYAQKKGIAPDWLPYTYCTNIKTHVPKNSTCIDHEEKQNERSGIDENITPQNESDIA